jgi:hypothetical protein
VLAIGVFLAVLGLMAIGPDTDDGSLALEVVQATMPRERGPALTATGRSGVQTVLAQTVTRLAYVGADSRSVWTIYPDGTDNRRLLESREPISEVVWSRDGQVLAYMTTPPQGGAAPAVFTLDVTTGHSTEIPIDRLITGPITFHPDGRQLLAVSEDIVFICRPWVVTVAIDTGRVSRLVQGGCRISDLQVTPDGGAIVVTSGGSDPTSIVRRIVISTGRADNLTDPQQTIRALSGTLSPDGTRLIYVADRTYDAPFDQSTPLELVLANSDGSLARVIWTVPRFGDAHRYGLTISPSGSQIALNRRDSLDTAVWVVNADGTIPRQVVTGRNPVWQPAPVALGITAPVQAPIVDRANVTITVSVDRGEQGSYRLGDPIAYCVAVSRPVTVRLVNWVDDGEADTIFMGPISGRQCINQRISAPVGRESVRVEALESGRIIASDWVTYLSTDR